MLITVQQKSKLCNSKIIIKKNCGETENVAETEIERSREPE